MKHFPSPCVICNPFIQGGAIAKFWSLIRLNVWGRIIMIFHGNIAVDLYYLMKEF